LRIGFRLIGLLALLLSISACDIRPQFDCQKAPKDFSCKEGGSRGGTLPPPSLGPLNKALGLSGTDELVWWDITGGRVHPFASLMSFTSEGSSRHAYLNGSGGYGGLVFQDQTPQAGLRFMVWTIQADSQLEANKKMRKNLLDEGLSESAPGITKGEFRGFPAYWREFDGPDGTTTVGLWVATPDYVRRFYFVAPTSLRSVWRTPAIYSLTTVEP
jgi:hypothetical protein